MILKSNLEVVILWYFANFQQESALAKLVGNDYELPFSSSFFDVRIAEIIMQFENQNLIPRVAISLPREGVTLGVYEEEYKSIVKNAKLPLESKRRLINNEFYFQDVVLLEKAKVTFESGVDFFYRVIFLDLQNWRFPSNLDVSNAVQELNRYKAMLQLKYTKFDPLADEFEILDLKSYLTRTDICKKAYEHYCLNFQFKPKYSDEFELSEADLEYFIDNPIAMVSVLISEDLGQIKVRRLFLTYNPHHRRPIYTNVVGDFVLDTDRKKNSVKLFKIFCSKKTERGHFYIVVNDISHTKIHLNYKSTYAKLLYDVIHTGKYTHKNKQGLDEHIRRACGVTTGTKITFKKYLPDIEFVNFLERVGVDVLQRENSGIELVPEDS